NPIGPADSAPLVPTVGLVVRKGPRSKSNRKAHALSHLRRPAVTGTPVGGNRSVRQGYDVLEELPATDSRLFIQSVLLDIGQQQSDEDADDGNDNEQLDQRKRPSPLWGPSSVDHGDLRMWEFEENIARA